jgi:prepilin-type N-terminal cleavage/methylation domain-containing protein
MLDERDMTRRARRLRSDESGFTLIELLTSMTIGMILLMAALVLLEHSTALSKQIGDRQDAVQRGRQAMEIVVRDLRSQVCLGDETEPITVAADDRVTFFADLSDGSTDVQQRTIRYDAAGKKLFEDIHVGTGVYPDLVFPATPTQSRLLLTGVEPVVDAGVTRPVLRYYAFRDGGVAGDLQQLVTPLISDDAIRTVMVKVAFVVQPDGVRPRSQDATMLESDVYVRLADPSTPSEGPRCI